MQNYHANDNGGTTSSGKIGSGYYYDNAGDYLNITKPTKIMNKQQLTISGWLKYVSGDGNYLYHTGETNNEIAVIYYHANKRIYILLNNGTTNNYAYTNLTNDPVTYTNIITIFNGTANNNSNKLKIYVNGTLKKAGYITNKAIPNHTPTGTLNAVIGGRAAKPGSGLGTNGIGYVDEILIYNGSLNSSQITYIYNSGNGRNWDTIAQYFQVTLYTITAANITITNTTNKYNCTHTNINYHNKTITYTYRWYKNDALTGITTQTINKSTYIVGQQAKCEVTATYSYYSSAANSTNYLTGDVQNPTITNINIPVTGTTIDYTIMSADCTDDSGTIAADYPKINWKDPNNDQSPNYTMTLTSGNTYTLQRIFTTPGTYHDFKIYCQDGNGHTSQAQSNNNLTINTGSTTGGNSGGGSTNAITTTCGLNILSPTNLVRQLYCANGEKANDVRIELYNTANNQLTVSAEITGNLTGCEFDPQTGTISGAGGRGLITLSNCNCPAIGETNSGTMIFKVNNNCQASIPIILNEGNFEKTAIIAIAAFIGLGLLITIIFKVATA